MKSISIEYSLSILVFILVSSASPASSEQITPIELKCITVAPNKTTSCNCFDGFNLENCITCNGTFKNEKLCCFPKNACEEASKVSDNRLVNRLRSPARLKRSNDSDPLMDTKMPTLNLIIVCLGICLICCKYCSCPCPRKQNTPVQVQADNNATPATENGTTGEHRMTILDPNVQVRVENDPNEPPPSYEEAVVAKQAQTNPT